MKRYSPLAPDDFAPIAPVVAQVVADLFGAHPSLSRRADVQVALLAVTERYIAQLRHALAPATELADAEVRRAFVFLANTARPLSSAPDATAAELVTTALQALRTRGTPQAHAAAQAFERAIARIVHLARLEIAARVCTAR